jgi:hypothetical protein
MGVVTPLYGIAGEAVQRGASEGEMQESLNQSDAAAGAAILDEEELHGGE